MALQDEFNRGRRSIRRSRPSRGRRFVDPRTQPRMGRQPPMQRRMPPPNTVGVASPRPMASDARYTSLQNQFQQKLRNDSQYQDYQMQMQRLNQQRNQQINQLLVNAGLPALNEPINSQQQLRARQQLIMQYNQSPQAAQLGEQMMTMGNQIKTYVDSTYASDIAELREMQPRLGRPTQGVGGLQATPLGLPIQGAFGSIGQAVPVSTSLGNSMFNQDANYVIKGDKLYKDGKWIGSLGGGMMGGGRAGQNQIVMGNDAVVDVPDWVFKTAERQEPDPVVTTPSTSTVSPKGTLYDIMTGGLGGTKPKGVIPRPKPAVNPGMDTTKKPPRKKPTGTPKAPVKTKPVGGTKPKPKAVPKGTETGPAVKGVMSPKSPKLRTPPKPEVNVGKAPTRPTGRTPSTRGPNNRPRPSVRQGLSTPRTKPPSTNSKEFNPMNDRNKKSNTKPKNPMGMFKGGMAVKSNFGSNDFRTTGTTISVVDNRKKK